MPAFAVFEPPSRKRSLVGHTDGYIFLRDRFNLVAFIFGPFWMIWRRLWLVLAVYLILIAATEYGLRRFGTSLPVRLAVFSLISFLVGLEATSLRRWTLIRRGWRDCGIVIADDLDLAERRFFDAKLETKSTIKAMPVPPAVYLPPSGGGPDVLGLFPEPRGGR